MTNAMSFNVFASETCTPVQVFPASVSMGSQGHNSVCYAFVASYLTAAWARDRSKGKYNAFPSPFITALTQIRGRNTLEYGNVCEAFNGIKKYGACPLLALDQLMESSPWPLRFDDLIDELKSDFENYPKLTERIEVKQQADQRTRQWEKDLTIKLKGSANPANPFSSLEWEANLFKALTGISSQYWQKQLEASNQLAYKAACTMDSWHLSLKRPLHVDETRRALKDKDKVGFIIDQFNNMCREGNDDFRPFVKNAKCTEIAVLPAENLETSKQKNSKLLGYIHRQLERPISQPVALSFCSSAVYQNQDDQKWSPMSNCAEYHVVTIVGRARNPQTNKCEFLARDSSESTCKKYDKSWRCKSATLWINEDTLLQVGASIQFLEEASISE